MKNTFSPLRPAMTAIAAVIALSSTASFAQSADGSADPAAPTVTAPPVVAAPQPAPEISAAPSIAAPTAMKMVGTPVIHQAEEPSAVTPRAAPAHVAPASAKRIAATPVNRAAAPVAARLVTPPRNAPVPTEAAPVPPAAPVTTSKAADVPPAVVAASPVTVQPNSESATQDETLPIAGGVGLAIIALGGAYAASRRRRHARTEVTAEPFRAAPIPQAQPVAPVPAAAMATPVVAHATGTTSRTLPNGFDISRFGRHTQAAYLGRTAENPSYSLKRRLKRASFFDQREREAIAAGRMEQPVAAPATQTVRHEEGQVTVRLAPQKKTGVFGYVFQR